MFRELGQYFSKLHFLIINNGNAVHTFIEFHPSLSCLTLIFNKPEGVLNDTFQFTGRRFTGYQMRIFRQLIYHEFTFAKFSLGISFDLKQKQLEALFDERDTLTVSSTWFWESRVLKEVHGRCCITSGVNVECRNIQGVPRLKHPCLCSWNSSM